MSERALACPGCGWRPPVAPGSGFPVYVTGTEMKFWHIVGTILTWAIASIPAAIILMIVGFVTSACLVGFTGGLKP